MRLSALIPAPRYPAYRPPLGTPLPALPWGAVPRLPRPPVGVEPSLPPLDAGFFFPLPPLPTSGSRVLRRLRLRFSHGRRPRPRVRRALGLWGVLGAGRLRTPSPLPPGAGAAGSLLSGPNFSSSLRRTLGGRRVQRPRKWRLRRLRSHKRLHRPRRGARPTPPRPALGLGGLLRPAFRPRRLSGRGAGGGLRGGLLRPPHGAPHGGPWATAPEAWSRSTRGPSTPHPLPIPQVRYKPGLAHVWRTLRLQFCLAWGLPWARQRRLTQFISQLRGVTGLGFLHMCLGGLGALIKESGLSHAGTLARGGWVNGRLIRNPFFQLYKGDRVALAPTEGGHPRRDLGWLAFLSTAPLGAWEVDGLTRAVTVISDPAPSGRRPILGRPMPFLTFRMYNWKYKH